PKPDPAALVVKDVANLFLTAKQRAVAAGELSERTWNDYHAIMDKLVSGLGKHKLVATLLPADFATLKAKLARTNGPRRMSVLVTVIRSAFKFAFETGDLTQPVRFGPEFKIPTRKTMRLHRAKQGAKLFTAEEINRLLAAAGPQLQAMILLGINCGFGNA